MNTTTLSAATGAAQIERLGEHLKKLHLRKSAERLEALLQHAAAQELPYADFLEQVLGEEVAAKRSQNIAMRTAMARFPFVKPLETFDFAYQPSIDKKQVLSLANCHFIEHGDNILVLGPPGVGKSHLAVSLGLSWLPGAVHHRGAPDRLAHQGPCRRQTRRQAQGLHRTASVDH